MRSINFADICCAFWGDTFTVTFQFIILPYKNKSEQHSHKIELSAYIKKSRFQNLVIYTVDDFIYQYNLIIPAILVPQQLSSNYLIGPNYTCQRCKICR